MGPRNLLFLKACLGHLRKQWLGSLPGQLNPNWWRRCPRIPQKLDSSRRSSPGGSYMEPGLKITSLNFPTPLGFGIFLFRGSAKVSFALQEQIKDSLPVFMSEVVWWSPCCHLQNLYYWKLNFSNISRLLESFKESDLHTKWSSIQASLLSHSLPAHLLVGTEHYILRVFFLLGDR